MRFVSPISLVLCTIMLMACIACSNTRRNTSDDSVAMAPPRFTIVPIPESMRLIRYDNRDKQEEEILRLLKSSQFKSLFAYFDPGTGHAFNVRELGLEVTDFRGTLQPLRNAEFSILLKRVLAAGGAIRYEPVLSLSAEALSGEYLRLRLSGDIWKISPEYTLVVDPIRPLLPAGFLQDLYYAERVSVKSFQTVKASGEASGRFQLIQAEASAVAAETKALQAQYENAIFGEFGIVSDRGSGGLISNEVKEVPLKPGTTVNYVYGKQQRPLVLQRVDSTEVEVLFLGLLLKFCPQAYVQVNKWTVLEYRSIDTNRTPALAHIALISFDDDFIRSFGPKLRFKRHAKDIPFEMANIADPAYVNELRQLPETDRDRYILEAARAMKNEHRHIVQDSSRVLSPGDFIYVANLIRFIAALDDDNGHALYYSGDMKRWLNKGNRSSRDYWRSHEDYDRYLSKVSSISRGEQEKPCYESARGFCKERTAWILHSMTYDFYREACRVQREVHENALVEENLRQAVQHANSTLEIWPDGFSKREQFIATKVMKDWAVEQLSGRADHCQAILDYGS